jgi:hypothetical protein
MYFQPSVSCPDQTRVATWTTNKPVAWGSRENSFSFLRIILLLCVAEGGASSNECSEIYAGTGPFSTVETSTLADTIRLLNPTVYFSFHSYSQLLMVPFGHRFDKANNYYKLVRSDLLSIQDMCTLLSLGHNISAVGYLLSVQDLHTLLSLVHNISHFGYLLSIQGLDTLLLLVYNISAVGYLLSMQDMRTLLPLVLNISVVGYLLSIQYINTLHYCPLCSISQSLFICYLYNILIHYTTAPCAQYLSRW